MEVLLNVIKNIFCVQGFKEKCNKCSLCHLIDIGNLPSFKIIEPYGSFIKKGQILDLKRDFSTYSQLTDKKIYIIKNCEKMNKESANTMLKFLEEPDDNIIGFFITLHADYVMPTIQSRCQLINANFSNNMIDNLNITEEEYNEYLSIVKEYIKEIEVNKQKSIIINKELFSDFEKEQIKIIFQIILDIYNAYLSSDNAKYLDFSYLSNYNKSDLSKKINIIIEVLNKLAYNVNIDLLLDQFVLEMDGVNNESI
jgi:DNA polymerase III delta prime subunit